MELQLQFDPRDLARLTGPGIERAVVSALRKGGRDALRAMRATAKKGTREKVRIRAGYLADRSFPLRRRGTGLADLVWELGVSGQEVPLGEYPRRATRRGVSVEVARGKRTLLKSAFLARRKAVGREGVFLRPGKERYPMGHRLGLSVAQSMADGRTPRDTLNRGVTVLRSAFLRLLPLELGRVR